MLDKDMREPLFDFLDEYYGKVRVIEEKIIFESRADVLAVLDSMIVGIEIKSDSDTYTRLKTQIKDYDKYCDLCYIAVGVSHEKHVAEHIPDYWGILVISENEVRLVREPSANPNVQIEYQLSLLWRAELLSIQLKYEYPKYQNKSRLFIYRFLIERLGEQKLKRAMTDVLFERDYTIFDDKKKKRIQARTIKKAVSKGRKIANVTNYIGRKRKSSKRKRTAGARSNKK